jgi:hypothetical protein
VTLVGQMARREWIGTTSADNQNIVTCGQFSKSASFRDGIASHGAFMRACVRSFSRGRKWRGACASHRRQDACGALGASTGQKLWSAFRMLSLGIPADAAVEHGSLAESTNAECLKLFARAIVEIFETEWLSVMTMDDAKDTAAHYRGLGCPGCICCVDCASWKWDSCLMEWYGQCK